MERFREKNIRARVASMVGAAVMLATGCETPGESDCTGQKQYVLQKGEAPIEVVEEEVGNEANVMDLKSRNPGTDFQKLGPGDPFYGPESCPPNSN